MATIPTPAELQYQRAHINDNLVPSLLASNIVCLTLATVAVALRFVCRWVSNIKYQYDDWLIVAGLVRIINLTELQISLLTHFLGFYNSRDYLPIHWCVQSLLCRCLAYRVQGIRYGAGRHTIVYTTSTTSDKGFTRVCEPLSSPQYPPDSQTDAPCR